MPEKNRRGTKKRAISECREYKPSMSEVTSLLDEVLHEHFEQIATLAEDYYEIGYVMCPIHGDFWQLLPAGELVGAEH